MRYAIWAGHDLRAAWPPRIFEGGQAINQHKKYKKKMRTPKEYSENLKQGIITENMLSDVLYSYSKRAKNYRDRIRNYLSKKRFNRFWYDKYNNIDSCEAKKVEYYRKKSDILKTLSDKVTAIHQVEYERRKRIYDYEKEWNLLKKERVNYKRGKDSKVVWMNEYFDADAGTCVEFCDVMQPGNRYFLYYEIGQHSFHSPIEASELKQYIGVEVVELEELTTYGEDIANLLSVSFCEKVYEQIMKGKSR